MRKLQEIKTFISIAVTKAASDIYQNRNMSLSEKHTRIQAYLELPVDKETRTQLMRHLVLYSPLADPEKPREWEINNELA